MDSSFTIVEQESLVSFLLDFERSSLLIKELFSFNVDSHGALVEIGSKDLEELVIEFSDDSGLFFS